MAMDSEVGAAHVLAAGGVEVGRLGRAVRLQQVGEELEHLAVELALDRVEARAALVGAGGAVALVLVLGQVLQRAGRVAHDAGHTLARDVLLLDRVRPGSSAEAMPAKARSESSTGTPSLRREARLRSSRR